MHTKSQLCLETLERTFAKVIDSERRFPNNVFLGVWGGFHLFECELMFEADFVGRAVALLNAEGSSCASLLSLNRARNNTSSVFTIDRDTTAADYESILMGSSPVDGWMYDMDRFACISNKGEWCIYTERNNEIAVIGFREGASIESYRTVLGEMDAGTVADVMAGRAAFDPSPHVISQECREQMPKQYSDLFEKDGC